MQCPSGKIQYNTEAAAESAIIDIYRQRAHNPKSNKKTHLKTATGIYICRICRVYHLTSQYDNRSDYIKEKCDFILSRSDKSIRKKIKKQEPHAKTHRIQTKTAKTPQTLRHEKSNRHFSDFGKEKSKKQKTISYFIEEENLDGM